MSRPDDKPRPDVVALSTLPAGAFGRVAGVEAGAGLRARLVAMGLRSGVEVSVVRNHGPGPFVVAVHGTRIVLGRGMAHKVMVVPPAPARGKGTAETEQSETP